MKDAQENLDIIMKNSNQSTEKKNLVYNSEINSQVGYDKDENDRESST